MNPTLFFDTNALLTLQEKAFKEQFYISQKTLEEIEQIKTSGKKDGEVKYKARVIARLLDNHCEDYTVIKYDSKIKEILDKFNLDDSPDNIILATAYYCNSNICPIVVCTDDLNCKFISKNIFELITKGINDIDIVKNVEEYTGYTEVTLNDDEMSYLYCHLNENSFGCLINEYLIVKKSDGEIVDYRRWDGQEFVALSYKQINSHYMGKIKPRNPQQVIAFDMLQNKNETIKVISGKAGSGKDYIMLSNALKLIEDGKYDKLLYVRNPIGVKDVSEIGFIPGNKQEKLRPYAMLLADHLGGETGLDTQIMSGNIEIEHLGYMRGRDIKNTIVYCTEAENLTREHVSMLVSRIGVGSSLWMNGDYRQTDSYVFRMNNGLLSVAQKLAGNPKFGYVRFEKTERSETAELAELLN